MPENLELTIDALLLDLDNPRIGSATSQSEALASIVRLNPTHFRNLMASIRDHGLDPGDSLYVTKAMDDIDFLVLEGNRRLSALTVLSNPDVLVGTDLPDGTKKLLAREATGFVRSVVEPLRCVYFRDREQANDWIRRRHTGTADGEGRITWKPLEIQKFSGDHSVIDVIDFVGRNAGYADKQWEKTKSTLGGMKSTSLTRLLESAAGRTHLDISVKKRGQLDKIPFLQSDPEWALRVLKHIVEDIMADKINTRQLNRTTDIERYFQNLPQELQPGANTTAATPRPFRDIDLAGRQTTPRKPKPSPRKTQPVARTRTTLAPKKHPFETSNSTKLQMLLREAGSLNVSRFPLSCAFLLRAIVESAVNDYLGAHSMPLGPKGEGEDFPLKRKAEDVLQHIRENGPINPTDMRAFRNYLLTQTSACSIQSLNGFVHNRYQLPTADALLAGWEAVVPVLIAVYGKV